jgi:hypothetical protein
MLSRCHCGRRSGRSKRRARARAMPSAESSSIPTCLRPSRVGRRRDLGCSHTLRYSKSGQYPRLGFISVHQNGDLLFESTIYSENGADRAIPRHRLEWPVVRRV